MRFPQTLPDIRDEMDKLSRKFIPMLDPQIPRNIRELSELVERLNRLTGALTEAIVNQARS